MKKIKLMIVLIFLIFLNIINVYAYTFIKDYEFEKYMEEHQYKINVLANGPLAYKVNEETGTTEEEYQHLTFETDELAIENLKETKENYKNFIGTYKIEDEYGIENIKNKDNSYSYLEVTYAYRELPEYQYYTYFFRYHNVIVYGTASIDKKEIIHSTITDLFKDKNKIDTDKTSNNNNIIIIISIAIISLILCIILLKVFSQKKEKKS